MAEYEAADRGERGAILRREGLYSSHLIEWRQAADAGARCGLAPATRDRRDREIEQLRASAEKGEAELARTRAGAHEKDGVEGDIGRFRRRRPPTAPDDPDPDLPVGNASADYFAGRDGGFEQHARVAVDPASVGAERHEH